MLETLTIVKLVAGFALLFCGGEVLVRGSVSLARRLEVSPFLIGATVIAFGTSAPELVVSLKAAFQGAMGIALGNIVGSNIANLLLILGLSAIIAPVVVNRGAVLRDGLALAAFLGQNNSAADGAENTTLGAWLGIGVTVRSEPERGRENWEIEAA